MSDKEGRKMCWTSLGIRGPDALDVDPGFDAVEEAIAIGELVGADVDTDKACVI